mmetsp:Transcript_17840/g.43657  ORF Transcript_17840/g.43657 Transcript_17840/m.43657 type:complete len:99 (+) Transcript_17840:185-481(+)
MLIRDRAITNCKLKQSNCKLQTQTWTGSPSALKIGSTFIASRKCIASFSYSASLSSDLARGDEEDKDAELEDEEEKAEPDSEHSQAFLNCWASKRPWR